MFNFVDRRLNLLAMLLAIGLSMTSIVVSGILLVVFETFDGTAEQARLLRYISQTPQAHIMVYDC